MPYLARPDAEIYYEEYGAGYPVMIFAPGGLRSQIEFWRRQRVNPETPPVWMDPTATLAPHFRVIAMDQRSSPVGKSRARIGAGDGWDSFAGDHLALMDHLKIERCHVMGGCIGSSFSLKLCALAPERISSAVLQNPIGLGPDNAGVFPAEFRRWVGEYRGKYPEADLGALESFRKNLYGTDFVFSVTREFVKTCRIPLLVMPGDDAPHPTVIGEEIARLAPKAEILRQWKGPAHLDAATAFITAFLLKHTPKS